MGPGFFDLQLPDELFNVLERTLARYNAERGKRIEDVFLLVLGLSHLKEWIAPGYSGGEPTSAAERFAADLYQLPAYRTIRDLGNVAKHQEPKKHEPVLIVDYGLIDDAPDFDAIVSIDDGPPIGYHIDEHDVSNLFGEVLQFYRDKWFSLPVEQRYD